MTFLPALAPATVLPSRRGRRAMFLAVLAATALPDAAQAQNQADVIAQLRQELDAVHAEQARSNQRIAELEARLNSIAAAAPAGGAAIAAMNATAPVPAASAAALAAAATAHAASAPPSAPAAAASRLSLSGDLRLRYESNFGGTNVRNRDREILRARLRASYAINPWLTIGGQIATGDPRDPRTTDVTLTNFNDKLAVNLDQIYMRAKFGNLQVDAGKIAQPFAHTELVWDNDVTPKGISAAYRLPLGSAAAIKATGLYFIIDEAAKGPDSRMIGGQLGLELSPGKDLKLELAGSYYGYKLDSTANADSTIVRTNLFANGRYLSDFHLLDVIGAVNWTGLGEQWPVRIVGDYVKNYGAVTAQDSGFEVDMIVGRASKPGDLRFTYGYSQVGTDAVLAAYSHDNTGIATNYRQHTLVLDYTLTPNVILTGTYYRYKPLNAIYAGANNPNDWLNRARLNVLVNF